MLPTWPEELNAENLGKRVLIQYCDRTGESVSAVGYFNGFIKTAEGAEVFLGDNHEIWIPKVSSIHLEIITDKLGR